MRTFELVLVVANLVALVLLVAPLRGRARGWWLGALIPLLATGAHLLVEGPRWQMAPAYATGGVLVLAGLWRTVAAARRPGERLGGGRAAALGVGLGVPGLALSAVLPLLLPVFHLPTPTGRYGIGTLTYHWVDQHRPEVLAEDPDARRELMVQVWYPAEDTAGQPRAPYIPDAGEVAQALARLRHLPAAALGHLEHVTSNAVEAAPVADDRTRYPVLVSLVGRGGYRQENTFQIQELVSNGYIVASLDQPYAAGAVVFPDGRRIDYDSRMDDRTYLDHAIPHLAADARFVVDRLAELDRTDPVLAGRLDLDRTGLLGHSLGGVVGAEVCRTEPRVRACLLEDAHMPPGVVRAGLRQPTMWITRDAETMRLERRRAGGWTESDIDEHLSTMRAVYEFLPGDGYYLEVPGLFHLDITDAPLMSPLAARLGLTGPLGPGRAHPIINAYSLAFFDRHLRGEPAALLDGDDGGRFPEVRLETRRR